MLEGGEVHLLHRVCRQALQDLLLVHLSVDLFYRVCDFVLVLLHKAIKFVVLWLFVRLHFAIVSVLLEILAQRRIFHLEFLGEAVHCARSRGSNGALVCSVLDVPELAGGSAIQGVRRLPSRQLHPWA